MSTELISSWCLQVDFEAAERFTLPVAPRRRRPITIGDGYAFALFPFVRVAAVPKNAPVTPDSLLCRNAVLLLRHVG